MCVEFNVVFAGVSNVDEKHTVSLKWNEFVVEDETNVRDFLASIFL